MKLRHPILIRSTSWLLAALLRPWLASLRIDEDAGPSGPHPADAAERRFIYLFWHESLLSALLYRHARAHVLISEHADGQLIAQVCDRMGVGTVRGSARRGGAKALLQMYRLSTESHLVIMPDGPRGPRRHVQPGVVQLASHTGLPIIPVGVGFQAAWRARSWDRFAVPRPFSTVYLRGGDALTIPPRLTPDEWERQRLRVEAEMLAVTAAAEEAAREPVSSRTTSHVPRRGAEAAAMTPAAAAVGSGRQLHTPAG